MYPNALIVEVMIAPKKKGIVCSQEMKQLLLIKCSFYMYNLCLMGYQTL